MSRDDWFRNTDWTPHVEKCFLIKLSRSRKRGQYLRIQACTLRSIRPEVALDLLERYFAIGDQFDTAQAYADQAEAYLALGEEERAIEAYESALKREQDYPGVLSDARIDFPFLIATRRRREKYDKALELLQTKELLLFPYQVFKREASLALISADRGHNDVSRAHAMRALDVAKTSSSAFVIILISDSLERNTKTLALLRAMVL